MDRITDTHLEALCTRINRMTQSPEEAYTKGDDGKYHANIGNYHISHAYGGVCLHRMQNEAGGASDVLRCGHVPKRKLWDMMHAYVSGLYDAVRAKGE